MVDTGFLRSDELPGRTAPGYLTATPDQRLHLPVRGSGDGGIYSTVADSRLLAGAVRRTDRAGGGSPRWSGRAATCPASGGAYGLGFWLQRDGRS